MDLKENVGNILESYNNRRLNMEDLKRSKSLQKLNELIEKKNYLVRMAKPKDRDELSTLYPQIFGDIPFFENLSQKEAGEIIEEDMRKGSIIVPTIEGKIVGFLALKEGFDLSNRVVDRKRFEGKKVLYISDIAVSKKIRKCGIGSDLFKVGEKARIIEKYDLSYMRTNASISIQEIAKDYRNASRDRGMSQVCAVDANLNYMELARKYGEDITPDTRRINTNEEVVYPSMSSGIAVQYGYVLARDIGGVPILITMDNPNRDKSIVPIEYIGKELGRDIRCFYVKEKEECLAKQMIKEKRVCSTWPR